MLESFRGFMDTYGLIQKCVQKCNKCSTSKKPMSGITVSAASRMSEDIFGHAIFMESSGLRFNWWSENSLLCGYWVLDILSIIAIQQLYQWPRVQKSGFPHYPYCLKIDLTIYAAFLDLNCGNSWITILNLAGAYVSNLACPYSLFRDQEVEHLENVVTKIVLVHKRLV